MASFKRFQREPSSREPSIWDVYAGQYPELTAWGAPTYQHWYPYPFGDPNAPKGSVGVSPSEKLGDPGAAAGGGGAGGPSAGVGGVGGGVGGGGGAPGGVGGSPFSGVMPPAVDGSGESFIEPFGGEGVASPTAPGVGDVVGTEPSHVGRAAALAASLIPLPVPGALGLGLQLGQMVGARALGNVVAGGVPRTTEMIEDYDEEGKPVTVPVAPTSTVLGMPTGYQPVPVTVPQTQIFDVPATKPVHTAKGAPPENERGLMDTARASAPAPGFSPAPPQSDIFSDIPYSAVEAPQTRGSAPAPSGPPATPTTQDVFSDPAFEASQSFGGGGDGGSSK